MGCCTSTPPEHHTKSHAEPLAPEKKPLIDDAEEKKSHVYSSKYESKYDESITMKSNTILEPKKYISDKIVMHLSVHDVIGMDNDSLSDPFIVVYEMEMSTETFKEIGRTEIIKDNYNADFAKEFIVPYIFNEYQLFRFDVYDLDSLLEPRDLSKHDYLGSATFILAEIIHEIGSIQTKKLLSKNGEFYKNKKTNKFSTITVYVDTNHNENMKNEMLEKFIQFDIVVNSNLGARNTLCSIYRMDENRKQTIKVYSTEVVPNNNKPKYKTIYIDTFTLCRSDYTKDLLFKIDEHYEDKNDKTICSEIISMNVIIQNKDTSFSKNKISVQNIKCLMYNLTDYLYDSFDLSVIFGIDFTASNGDPQEAYSLHYIYDKTKLSHYQIAIRAVGNILASYDSDNMYPVYGFGAKLLNINNTDEEKYELYDYELGDILENEETNFVFPINENNDECQGIFNVENEYRNILQSNLSKNKLILSAPTNFGPLLEKVIKDIENICTKNKNIYFVFLIITDGQITDMKQTKQLIQYAADKPLPLSIIIIGVGNDNFDNMIELDGDDGTLGKRDIVQFVQMNAFINAHNDEINTNRLSMEVLYEIPNQLLSYMAITNSTPNLEIHKKTDIKAVTIGTIYNINLNQEMEAVNVAIDYKQERKEETKEEDNALMALKITADTPLPFGWERYYDHDGNIVILDEKGRAVNKTEFFNMINVDYNNDNNVPNGKKNWLYPEVDLVFCLDVTGSMQNEIDSCKRSIENIITTIKNNENAHIRFGYVAYRDHPGQESTFLTKTHQFTTNVKKMKEYLSLYNARGGGDGPEAVAAGLNQCLLLNNYRRKAVKIIVLITDAAPHGIGCNGDSIKKGDPNGLDLIKLANDIREKGILLYILGCEPDLGDERARDVYRCLCKITDGKYIGIIDEALIAPIIIKSVSEEINTAMLQYHVKMEMDQNGMDIDDNKSVFELLANKLNKKQKLVNIEDIYGQYDESNINLILSECKNIKDIRNKYKKISRPRIKTSQSKNIVLEIKEIDDKCIKRIIERINRQKQ